jgi:hypothetical protein
VSESSAERPWRLEGFQEQFDLWAERDELLSDQDLRLIILAWAHSRMDDPYRDVSRDPQVDNLWFGAIPGTDMAGGRVATGSYFVFESHRLVKCNSFAILTRPV